MPTVDRLRSKGPPNAAASAQHERQELEPAWQQPGAGDNDATATVELREKRHVVFIDDDIMRPVPLRCRSMLAKQCELLQVIAMTWCDERNVASIALP